MINSNNSYNPDVLTCLANLSNDEVFTSPKLANQILDLLPKQIWQNKNSTFLDPVSKSGIFLREITKRLIKGLENEIPDLQTRIDHILKNQVFAIAITEITALLSRRTLYCSKKANGKYSIASIFNDEIGNIKFDQTNHKWQNNKCVFCGANQSAYDREEELETHAYQFIHNNNPDKIFNMKFDVIIGNPPYQMSDGGFGKSSKPIYHKFIEQAKKLNPRYLTMIIPARWYNGGKGLDEFRNEMLNDKRISKIHDFPSTNDCFSGLNIRGGVCYFLWERDYNGDCEINTHKKDIITSSITRPLLEEGFNIFIRYNESIKILNKVREFKEPSFNTIVSSRKPFGLATNFSDFLTERSSKNDILLHRFGDNGYISEEKIINNHDLVKKYKILISYASPGDDSYPHLILSKPIVSEPNSCGTETYIVVGPFDNEAQSKNIANYMLTSFFRFMILLAKSTQHVTKKTYIFAPLQEFDQEWNDEKLYKKYSINDEEINFINSLIRPIEKFYD
jgi:site-specific DNA-methyltransferase (adenine-specific)